MKKDSFYFPHDYHAHADPKCSALIREHGMIGYGIYWMMVEVLHEQGGRLEKFPKLFDGLAHQFVVEKEALLKVVQALVQDYNLLKEDENSIWSDRVNRNILDRKQKYELKAQAGRIGGLKSAALRKNEATLEQNEGLLQANEAKSTKGEESKEKEKKGEEKKDSAAFLLSLKSNPKYAGINIDREMEKMDKWLASEKGEGKEKTPSFILNWLDRCEVPVAGKAERKWLV